MKTADCNSHQFFLAVYDVYRENVAAGNAAAERWTTNSHYRQELCERVKAKYEIRTGCKTWCFWFSEDGIVEAYLRWRKASTTDEKQTIAVLLTA